MADPNPQQDSVLDVTAERIARTYAQGFVGAAGGEADAAVADLEAVDSEIVRQHPRFAEVMRSAFVDHDARVGMIDRVLGDRVTPVVATLLKVLSAHGRLGVLSEVTRQARLLLDEAAGRAAVLVRLAQPVDDSLMQEIEQSIRARTGVEPVIRTEIDPDLVGGLEIRVGDTVFDGTIRTAFAKAHREIVHQTVNAIESSPERFTLTE